MVGMFAAWHASSGLGMQILERQGDIYGTVGGNAVRKVQRGCEEWDKWGLQYSRDDSGV